MTVKVNHSTPADGTFSAQGALAWDADHTLTGVGTMAEQNANNVNITGGSITGITIGSATNIAGGTANQLLYQTGAGATSFITAPTIAGTYLNWSGSAFQWSANPLGDVVGPASATDNAIARFDLTTGKLIQNSVVTVSDTGGIAGATTITDINYVDFNTAYATTLTAGQLGWDGNNTLGLGMSGGNVVQEIGLQTYIYGKATSAITKGQLIKKTGSNGSSGVVTFAPTTANMTNSGDIIGIAAENIALNGFGYIVSTGNLKGFDTTGSSAGETWADGDTLYYNPSGNGLLTKTKPSAPNIKTEVAIVINAGSGGSGSVAVEIIHGSVLGGTDSNVQISSPTGGQLISYDQTNQYWKNITLTDGTAINITETTGGAITIANTAPDQIVALTGAGTTTISGTYPNFTITSNDQYTGTVTAVTGTAPIASSGGTTPAISIPKATGSVDGYLSAADWTTFNSKVTSVSGTTGRITSSGGTTPAIDLASGIVSAGTTGSSTAIPVITVDTYGRVTNITTASNPQGTVTSVGGTGTVSGISLSGTVTSSGNLTLGGSLDLSSPPAIGGSVPNAITGTTITASQYVNVGGGNF